MKNIIEKLQSWINGKPCPPETIQIYPTNKCNLHCIFCCQQLNNYDITEEITKKKWFEVVNELGNMNVKNILISGGGEPLLSEATINIMELCKKYQIYGRMIHNGTLWNDKLVLRIINMGWDTLVFSIDGMEPTHDFLRGKKGSFSRIIQNITRFNKLKKKFASEKPQLETTTVLTVYNYKQIPEFVSYIGSLKIKHMTVEAVCVNNIDVDQMKLNIKQRQEFFQKILPQAKKIAKEKGISTNFTKLEASKVIEKTGNLSNEILGKNKNLKKSIETRMISSLKKKWIDMPCYEPWLWPKIEANGDVWPCSTVPLKENIKDKCFEKIWYGNQFNKFREKILNKKLDDSCKNCVLTHLHTTHEIRAELRNQYYTTIG